MDDFLQCVRGLVRPLVTFAVVAATIAFVYMQMAHEWSIPVEWWGMSGGVVAWWFWDRHKAKAAQS